MTSNSNFFTLSSIWPRTILLADEDLQHRKRCGMNVATSYKSINQTITRIEENGVMVNQYPDSFKERAKVVMNRYLRKNAIALKQKRTRINNN